MVVPPLLAHAVAARGLTTTNVPGAHHQVAEYLVSALEARKDGMTLETKSLQEYWADDNNGPC